MTSTGLAFCFEKLLHRVTCDQTRKPHRCSCSLKGSSMSFPKLNRELWLHGSEKRHNFSTATLATVPECSSSQMHVSHCESFRFLNTRSYRSWFTVLVRCPREPEHTPSTLTRRHHAVSHCTPRSVCAPRMCALHVCVCGGIALPSRQSPPPPCVFSFFPANQSLNHVQAIC